MTDLRPRPHGIVMEPGDCRALQTWPLRNWPAQAEGAETLKIILFFLAGFAEEAQCLHSNTCAPLQDGHHLKQYNKAISALDKGNQWERGLDKEICVLDCACRIEDLKE